MPCARHASRWAKKRLDVLLVERGLAETRSAGAGARARRARAGLRQARPAGRRTTSRSRCERPPRFVSRGGEKLAHALDALDVDPAGRDCLDVGASTGGFTDCLLQRGAARVIALDVGYGQLHPRLRADERVTVLERVNARSWLEPARSRPSSSSATSRSSPRRRVLPPVLRLAAPRLGGARARQAAVRGRAGGRAEGRRPRPRGAPTRPARVLRDGGRAGARGSPGIVDSGLPGPKGNREFVVHLIASEEPSDPDELERWIDDAVG